MTSNPERELNAYLAAHADRDASERRPGTIANLQDIVLPDDSDHLVIPIVHTGRNRSERPHAQGCCCIECVPMAEWERELYVHHSIAKAVAAMREAERAADAAIVAAYDQAAKVRRHQRRLDRLRADQAVKRRAYEDARDAVVAAAEKGE